MVVNVASFALTFCAPQALGTEAEAAFSPGEGHPRTKSPQGITSLPASLGAFLTATGLYAYALKRLIHCTR